MNRARELANRLALKNVRFEVQNIKSFVNLEHEQRYDLITSSTVMHQVVTFPLDRAWGLEDVDLEQGMNPLQQTLNGIRGLLTEDSGRYISVDRHPIPSHSARWVRALNHANLRVDWDRSKMLPWKNEAGRVQTFTLTVSHPHINPPIQCIEEVLALFGVPEFEEKMPDLVLEGAAAELLFRTFRNKRLVFGIEIDYLDGSGSKRMEIWQDSQIALVYKYSNTWYRRIYIGFALAIPDLIETVKEYATQINEDHKLRVSDNGSRYKDAYIDRDENGIVEICTIPGLDISLAQ